VNRVLGDFLRTYVSTHQTGGDLHHPSAAFTIPHLLHALLHERRPELCKRPGGRQHDGRLAQDLPDLDTVKRIGDQDGDRLCASVVQKSGDS
jgi:hypothetical protein